MWFVIGLLACGSSEAPPPVRATLSDGQVLMGSVDRGTLRLVGQLGEHALPLDEIGEVVPVEGGLAASNGNVVVWLRNGTELRGRWAEPAVDMALDVGGKQVQVAVPMERLDRFQTEGADRWPTAPVWRVRTVYGDDLVVDPEETRITLKSDLGTFSPRLSECLALRPVGGPEGPWRVELATGTVLVGDLEQEALAFGLPMGPDHLDLPLAAITSVDRQDWGSKSMYFAPAVSPEEERWFDRQALSSAKAAQ